ncbi:VapB protein (antitoxin to VapC) (plasmid) [Rhodovulum sp. P5]|uniref:type II toxin-antitoxin system Phd/YefM family antitoxin n=1 Tax=Rhodovulum sp. P5 TaxID=1564506 RepID=UPI0009C2011A|nr:type II toxin-antitoxin system Phd/YefM family antitoxin [Rhodovulum sp. P5]ARE42442.1 VapB protein (antitoxin to VapC) [Rhodovulum sp. P5]
MWTLHDAKNRFSEVVNAALAGTPQEISRRGKPAVVVLSASAYADMKARVTAERPSFAEHLARFPGMGDDDLPRLEARMRDLDLG